MIQAAYCVKMARYNAWQNSQLSEIVDVMDPADLHRERGAFFGSIMGTLSHLVWGDLVWISRFGGGASPGSGIPDSRDYVDSHHDWAVARATTDARIRLWADGVQDADILSDLTWFSGALGREVSRPAADCIVHMFNHQTHHRGQIHAMMTAAGMNAPVSDLIFLPEDF